MDHGLAAFALVAAKRPSMAGKARVPGGVDRTGARGADADRPDGRGHRHDSRALQLGGRVIGSALLLGACASWGRAARTGPSPYTTRERRVPSSRFRADRAERAHFSVAGTHAGRLRDVGDLGDDDHRTGNSRRAAAAALLAHRHTVDEDLATPDATRLATLERRWRGSGPGRRTDRRSPWPAPCRAGPRRRTAGCSSPARRRTWRSA